MEKFLTLVSPEKGVVAEKPPLTLPIPHKPPRDALALVAEATEGGEVLGFSVFPCLLVLRAGVFLFPHLICTQNIEAQSKML